MESTRHLEGAEKIVALITTRANTGEHHGSWDRQRYLFMILFPPFHVTAMRTRNIAATRAPAVPESLKMKP